MGMISTEKEHRVITKAEYINKKKYRIQWSSKITIEEDRVMLDKEKSIMINMSSVVQWIKTIHRNG